MSVTELVEVQKAVAEFDRVGAGIKALQEKYSGVLYDVMTTAGMKDAKSARAAVREPRYEIERIRKDAKAPILALGKKLDTEAKRITEELLAIENPIALQIEAEEARKEAEKQAAIAAEMQRVAALQERIAELRGNPVLSASDSSILISDHIQDLEEILVDETFAEFREQAEVTKAAGLTRLRELHAAAITHEVEQARLKAEREELAKLRAEQAERDRLGRARLAEEERQRAEQRAREEAEAKAIREAEQAALRKAREAFETQAKAERERIAEEERQARIAREAEARRQDEELQRRRAEQERLDREAEERLRLESERIVAEERALVEQRAAFAREQEAARQAQEPEHVVLSGIPSASDIVEVLAIHYDESPETIIDWLRGMDFCAVVSEEVAA